MLAPKEDPQEELLKKNRQQDLKLQDFEQLNKALERVCSVMQIEDALKRITEESLKLCNADQASILLVSYKKPHDAITLIREGEPGEEKLDYHLNRLLAGWVSKHKKSLLTHDLIDTFGRDNIQQKYIDIASVLSVPLVLQEKIIGVINLITQNAKQKFGEREQLLLFKLASPWAQVIHNAGLYENAFAETVRLKKEIADKYAFHGIIGHSPQMQSMFSLMERVIPTDVRVLIEGESGSGKERIARVVHYNGPRKESPFVAIDCGALPANLLESELFGYKKGAFTGANRDHKGLFEEAHRGTLFLDEIGNMPLEIQAKFLRAIQEGEIRPLGSSQVVKVDVRIIAATNKDLQAEVKEEKFREDLYFRLNVVKISLPALRERREDIPILANFFLNRMNEKYGKQIKGIQAEAIRHLETYSWPGNVRELEHAVERAVVLCQSSYLKKEDLPDLETAPPLNHELFQPRPLQDALNEFKKRYVSKILEQTGGNQTKAAEILKIQRAYLNQMIKKLEIE